jgi:hypothetical protein
VSGNAAKNLKEYLDSQDIKLGNMVSEHDIDRFESNFKVRFPLDFKNYLISGAGSNTMDKKALIQLHPWDSSTVYRFAKRLKWTPFRMENLPGLFFEFADHSISTCGYLLELISDTASARPVFWYPYNGQIEKVADSFTHFVERWISKDTTGVEPLEDSCPIYVKQRIAASISGN